LDLISLENFFSIAVFGNVVAFCIPLYLYFIFGKRDEKSWATMSFTIINLLSFVILNESTLYRTSNLLLI